jgi:hypothetical protein
MKQKEKTIIIAQEKKDAWVMPKKEKGSFDQALINLGVKVKS